MRSTLIKGFVAAAAVGLAVIPAGSAYATPADQPAHSEAPGIGNGNGQGKGDAARGNEGNASHGTPGSGVGEGRSSDGKGAVDIGDALTIERPDGFTATTSTAPGDPGRGNGRGDAKDSATGNAKGQATSQVTGGAAPAGCPNPHGQATTGHGANTSGAYDSTCDGSPSRNGNGGGNAKGKPCAGCVGNADGKNPPGQAPNGSDRNNGYECDGNHGVGRSNPAHSGCLVKPKPPAEPPKTPPTPKPPAGDPPHTPPAPPTKVLGETVTAAPTPDPSPIASPAPAAPAARPVVNVGPLAFTGANVLVLVAAGLGLVAVGLVVRRLGRTAADRP